MDEPSSPPPPGHTADVFSDAMMSLFVPAVQAAENGAQSLWISQKELNVQLDAVCFELEKFSSSCSAPPISQHLSKLSDLRQRMSALNNSLITLQDRLERLYAMAIPGARLGSLAAAFNATRAPPRPKVLKDELPLNEPILPLERVTPLGPPRSPQSSTTPPPTAVTSNVIPGTPNTALEKLRNSESSSATDNSGPSLKSFVSSAQHYDSAVSTSPQPTSTLVQEQPKSD